MTTEQHTAPRRLRRRSDERVIAGVASGLGDYFNVDPLLVRIALVASLVFGGLGFFIYGAAWLLVPDDASDRSIVERLLGGGAGSIPGGLLVLAGLLIALTIVGAFASSSDTAAWFAIALVVIAAGAVLLRRGGDDGGMVGPVPATSAATAGPAVTEAAAAPLPVVRRPRRPPSPLGWFVVGAALVGMGVMALASSVWGVAIEPGLYAGLALGTIGIGLLIGAWWGHARLLIVIGVLLLPVAWVASLIDVPIEGAWGSHRFSPSSIAEMRDEYRVAGGELILDLTRVDADGEPIAVDASVAVGELRVLLPDDASLELDASVGGGVMYILDGPEQDGTNLDDHRIVEAGEPTFILDLETGIGAIRVDTRQSEAR